MRWVSQNFEKVVNFGTLLTTRPFRGKLRYGRSFRSRAAMPPHPMSGPDSSLPSPAATSTFRAQLDDASFETDLVDLANRFSSKSGGGLPPELSTDLALEIVLNEIVEQACLATGATGAAVVLKRDGEMICRASSGANAPELGSRIDLSSGLCGECVKALQLQRSDDVTNDPRADADASKRLGIRSAMVMPLLVDTELIGVFELFSSEPNAFGERDEMTMDALARRTLSSLKRASEPMETVPLDSETVEAVAPALPLSPMESEATTGPQVPPHRFDFMTVGLGVAVLITALLLGGALATHLELGRLSARASRASAPAQTSNAALPSVDDSNGRSSEQRKVIARANSSSPVPPGGLSVYENGREVFRLPPNSTARSKQDGTKLERASSVEPETRVQLSPSAAEDSLLRRIEPTYPEDALKQGIQGAVVLDVLIASNGTVQNIETVSGSPMLVQASSSAVKQWRFKTQRVKGRLAEMETRVTLNFRLPQKN